MWLTGAVINSDVALVDDLVAVNNFEAIEIESDFLVGREGECREDIVVCDEIDLVAVFCGIGSGLDAWVFIVADFCENFFVGEITNLIFDIVNSFGAAMHVSVVRNTLDVAVIVGGCSALQNTVIEVYVTAVNAIYAALNFWGSRVDMAFAICIDAVVKWIFVLAESDVGGEIRDAMDTVSITIDCSACNIDILCTDTGTGLARSIGSGRDGAASHGDVAILPII